MLVALVSDWIRILSVRLQNHFKHVIQNPMQLFTEFLAAETILSATFCQSLIPGGGSHAPLTSSVQTTGGLNCSVQLNIRSQQLPALHQRQQLLHIATILHFFSAFQLLPKMAG